MDSSLIRKYSLFVLEVVKAHVATSPAYPRTMHYRGDGTDSLVRCDHDCGKAATDRDRPHGFVVTG